MSSLKQLWSKIPRKARVLINLLAIALVGMVLYVFTGSPSFTALQRYRRAEKANLVGPAQILTICDLENAGYDHLLVADDGAGVILYGYSSLPGSQENFVYREKNGDLTVLAAPDFRFFGAEEYVLDLPVFLFDDHPAAIRAELELTLSTTLNDVYFEKDYLLESQREGDGYFRFNIHAESENWYTDEYGQEWGSTLGAEGHALQEFSRMCGYSSAWNLLPQPVTVRLFDTQNALILEQELLIRCAAGQAHAQRGDLPD